MVIDASAPVLVVAPARFVPDARAALERLDPSVRRVTEITRAVRPLVAMIARAHASVPSRGVVVLASTVDEMDEALALGADEALVVPIDDVSLGTAIRHAALRASVRTDRAAETRTLEQVIAGVAESIDAPLAALALDVDALRFSADETGTAEDRSALDDCVSAIDRVARLVRDLHLIVPSLADHGAREILDLPSLVDQVLRILGEALGRRAHVERVDEDDLPQVIAPRRLLARTLAHVLVQAVDALEEAEGAPTSRPPEQPAPRLQRLRIALRRESEAVAIVIDARPDLDAAPASAPTALGAPGRLAAAREVLRSFDGELIAERSRDGGVRYVLFVPCPEPGRVTVARVEREASPRMRRPRILLVDGDERVLRATARAIGEHFDAVVASSGEEALALLAEASEGSIDALVVDHRLPDVTPTLFLDELRRRRADLATRVVFIVRTREEVPSTLAAPALEKPIRRAALLHALRDVLSRVGSPTGEGPLSELN